MSGRVLTNLSGFQNRTLTGLSNIDTAETDIADIKTKYDFDASVSTGNLLIGNSVGNYTTNRLTAGNNITITNGDGTISIASSFVEINAGTNLNKTTDINGTSLNLDAVIGGMTSINAFSLVTNISSAGNQFLLKDNSVGGFADGTFLTANASGLIVPTTQVSINTAVMATIFAGTNITKTTNTIIGGGVTTTFNLDSALTGMTNINGFTISNDISSAGSQFLVKDNSVGGFANGTFLTANASGLIVPTTQATINTAVQATILGGTNISKTESSGNISLNLDAVITGITSINGYNANVLTLNNSNQQFIVKDTSKSFVFDDIVGIDSNNKLTPILTRNGLNSGNGYLEIATNPTIETPTFTIKNSTSNCVLSIVSGNSTAYESKLFFTNNGAERARMVYSSSNNKWDCLTKAGAIHFKAYQDTNDGTSRLLLDNGIFQLQAGSSSVSLTDIITGDLTKVEIKKPIDMNDNQINFQTDNTNHFIKMNNGTDFNGLEYAGGGSGSQVAHYFKSTNGSGTDLMKLYEAKIEILRPLFMNSTTSNDRPIYLHTNDAFYVRYKNDSTAPAINGTDLGGFSGVRLSNTNTQSTNKVNLQTFGVSPRTADAKGSVEVYNKLSVIRNSAVLQQDANDTFTVRNTTFCKAIIHSDSGDCELALKCGSSNNDQAVIKRFTNDQFLISNVGEIKTSATNHNFFNSSTLRLAFQSDTNLVVYNGSTVKFASNDGQNAHSSRDYKKNINDLVESESINIIKNINPVSFEYIEQYWDEHDQADSDNCNIRKGFIWEDMKPILPQTTRTINSNNAEEETTKTLDMKMVVPDLTKTVQYLLNKVETLDSTISTLQEQLLTQSNLISNLQSQLNSN